MKFDYFQEALQNWQDVDVAQYHLAICLGLIPSSTQILSTRRVFWSNNVVGNSLYNILMQMVEAGVLLYREDADYQFRWNTNFEFEPEIKPNGDTT